MALSVPPMGSKIIRSAELTAELETPSNYQVTVPLWQFRLFRPSLEERDKEELTQDHTFPNRKTDFGGTEIGLNCALVLRVFCSLAELLKTRWGRRSGRK